MQHLRNAPRRLLAAVLLGCTALLPAAPLPPCSTPEGAVPSPPGSPPEGAVLPVERLAVEEPAARDLADLASRAAKWIVAIEVERDKDLPLPRPEIEPRARFITREARSYYQRPSGPVSGVLAARGGDVITSLYNVSGNVKSIRITLADGSVHPARLVAKSTHDDLALLRVEKPGPEPISFDEPEWADSSKLRAGQIVLAAGRSPDPGRVTVTRGIVSAIGRNGGRAIQTDAELNYGNVGGPILDLEGRIVAVSSFVGHTQPQWGLNSGVGFGATAGTVLEVLPRLSEGRDAEAPQPPFLGVQKDPEAPDLDGAKVFKVVEGSSAARAGIRPGDVIVEIDGTTLHNFDHLRRLIYSRKSGETVKLRVRRGSEVLELEPRLAAMVAP